MTTLLNALVKSTESSRARSYGTTRLEEEEALLRARKSIDLDTGDQTVRERASMPGMRPQQITESLRNYRGSVRDGTGHTCPRLAVVCPLTSIALEVDVHARC